MPRPLQIALIALFGGIAAAWVVSGLIVLASRLIYGRTGPTDDRRFARLVRRCHTVFAVTEFFGDLPF